MPAYAYRCTPCAAEIEVRHSMHDSQERACPACASPLKRVLSAPAIQFRGTGFYRNDSRASAPASTPAS